LEKFGKIWTGLIAPALPPPGSCSGESPGAAPPVNEARDVGRWRDGKQFC
jgi:hypothetical protein